MKSIIALLVFIIFSGCSRHIDNQTDKLFTLLDPSKTGIDFRNDLTETHKMNVIIYQDFYSGGGVAIGDIDNDELPDVFLTGNEVPAKMYKNLGDFRFREITEYAGLSDMGKGWFTGTTMADINNDGHLDIFIGKSGLEEPEDRLNLLYINQGDGTFVERARDYGLDHPGYAVNATFFDYDNDGDLDMYLVNQGPEKYEGGDAEYMRNQVHVFAGDKLFENIGHKFIDVTEQAGIYSSIIGFAHGVSAGDINNDGWEDLYVSNDFFEHDYIYLNNGDKTFREVIKSATKHISYFSMGNDLADFNNDGLLDVMVLDMVPEDNKRLKENLGGMKEDRFNIALKLGYHHQYMLNVLHLNNGNETFSEIGQLAGVTQTDWSWAAVFADFDNDGWKDLFVSNGIRKDIRNIDWGELFHQTRGLSGNNLSFTPGVWDMLLESMPSKKIPNYIYKNNGDLTYANKTSEWGMDKPSFSNGIAYADLDNDGDLDMVVNNIDEEAFVYRNNSNHLGNKNYLRLDLTGSENNILALGTKVKIYHGDNYQYQQHYLTRGYRSSMEPVMHFGIGQDSVIDKVEIIWPTGEFTVLENVEANSDLTINYNTAEKKPFPEPEKKPLLFYKIRETLNIDYKHQENQMTDYMREPLLPYRPSNLGPPLAVADINNDGLDDIYVGGALRYPGAMYIQKSDGNFISVNEKLWWEDRLFEDMGAVFFDADNDKDKDLYVVSGGNEMKDGTEGLQDRLYLNDGQGQFTREPEALPPVFTSGSRAKAADFDNDGDMDLFVGGRMVPGNYPEPASSYILENENGKFIDVTDNIAPSLRNIGMVTDALWIDLDQDKDLDLLIAGEWMPITILLNEEGKFNKVENKNNGLEYSSGWWFSLAAYDFDQDGDEDIIGGNLGLNYRYKASRQEPFEIFYLDYQSNDNNNIIMAYYQDGKQYPIHDRIDIVSTIPDLEKKFPKNDPFAVATMSDIFGDEVLEEALHYQAFTFASSYIENLGNNTFRMKPLNNLAQISNHNAILIDDFNTDGFMDIVMAGNLYASEKQTIRNDAGIGVFLKGNGKGDFEAVPFPESGLYIDGDVKELKMLNTGHGNLILAAANNDSLQFLGINQPIQIVKAD